MSIVNNDQVIAFLESFCNYIHLFFILFGYFESTIASVNKNEIAKSAQGWEVLYHLLASFLILKVADGGC